MSATCTHKTFTNQTETTYVITLTGNTGSVTELLGTGDIFVLEYENIEPTKLHANPVQSARLEFNMLVRDANDQQILTNIFNADEGAYTLSITQDGQALFSGSVLNDMLEFSEGDYPNEAKIVAKDFTRLKGFTLDHTTIPTAVGSTRASISTVIEQILDPILDGRDINYFVTWGHSEVTGDFVDGIFLDTTALQDFNKREDPNDNTDFTNYDLLESICKNFGLIIRQALGEFQVYQYSAISQLPTISVDGNERYILPSSNNVFNPGVKRAKYTYDHRTIDSTITLPDVVEAPEGSLNQSTDFSQAFVSSGEQEIQIDARSTRLDFTSVSDSDYRELDLFARIQIEIQGVGQSFYWNNDAGEWTNQPTINLFKATKSRINKIAIATIAIRAGDIPASADGTLTVRFFNGVSIKQGKPKLTGNIEFVADATTYGSTGFEIFNEQSTGNTSAIAFAMTQDGTFSEEVDHGTVLFGEGPVLESPGSLTYSNNVADLTDGNWVDPNDNTVTFAELLLKEIIGVQSRGTRNLQAQLYGVYDGHSALLYDSTTFFFIGGSLTGNNVFTANFVEIEYITATISIFDQIEEDSGGGLGGTVTTDDLITFREAVKANQFFNTTFFSNFVGELSEAISAKSTITSIRADLSAQVRDGEDFILIDKVNERPYFISPTSNVNTGQNVTVNIEEQYIQTDLPVGSPIVLSGGLLQSYFTIDPTKLKIEVDNIDGDVASLELRVTDTESSITQSVQFDDSSGEVRLVAGPGGSEFSVVADQINIDGTTTFASGFDPSTKSVTIRSATEPTQRTDGSSLQAGDVWIDTDDGDRPYSYNGSNFVQSLTIIDGGNITTGTIDASVVNVSNINADNISVGTIDADRIGASSITANKLNVTSLTAVSTSTGNLNVDGTLTVQSGGSIQGSNYSFDDTGGTIAGWIIDSGTLKSNASGARIELNETDNRVSIFDAVGEKAVMGYLDGLDKNSGSGQWGSSNYGFWAKNGDELVIDGDVEYDSGDWLIENDASYKVLDGSSNEIIRLGTDSGNKGLFIYNTSQTTSSSTDAGRSYFTGDVIASFQDSELVVGDEASNTYMKYDDSAGKLEVAGDIEAKGVSTATAFAYKNIEIDSGNLSTYLKSYTDSGNTYFVLDLTTASSKESAQYIKFTVDTRSGGTDRPITHIVPPSNNADDSFEITIEVSGDGGTDRDEFVSFMDAPVASPTVTLSDGGSQSVSANFKIEAFRIFQGETQFDHVPMEGVLNSLGGFLQGVTHGQYTFRKDDDSFRLINSSVAQTARASQSMYIGKLEGGALLQAEPGPLSTSDGFDFIISPTKRYQNTGDNITESDDYTLSSNFDFSNELRFSQDDVRWEFDGDVYIGGTLTNPSDQRYKENVEELGDVTEKLKNLQTVIYDLKDFLPSDETKMIGLFAQEVEAVFPEAVVDGSIIDDNNEKRDMKSISYTQLVPVLVKAIQELTERIEALEG